MGAPWWVVIAAAVVGAVAAIAGSMWASRVARRSAGRAEWFRRLQWAWELTREDDRRSVAAGTAMMDYLMDDADRNDIVIIDRIGPITQEIGRLTSAYPGSPTTIELFGVDSNAASDDNGEHTQREGGDGDGPR